MLVVSWVWRYLEPEPQLSICKLKVNSLSVIFSTVMDFCITRCDNLCGEREVHWDEPKCDQYNFLIHCVHPMLWFWVSMRIKRKFIDLCLRWAPISVCFGLFVCLFSWKSLYLRENMVLLSDVWRNNLGNSFSLERLKNVISSRIAVFCSNWSCAINCCSWGCP